MNNQLSTSFHKINADQRINLISKLLWFLFNFANNFFPKKNIDPRIKISISKIDTDEKIWSSIPLTASPSRKISEIFWQTFPWQNAVKALGPIRALEIGCGSGRYSEILSSNLGASLNSYHGTDIKSSDIWKTRSLDGKTRFSVCSAYDIAEHLEGTNFLFSQSVLEHLDNDLDFFIRVRDRLKQTRQPLLQIHLLPSAPCLLNYLLHGVRQYTPRTISKISQLFNEETSFSLLGLGSEYSNQVHRAYITYPLFRLTDLRDRDPKGYDRSLRRAVLLDQQAQKIEKAAFYALIIQSGYKNIMRL
jgi:hypothetical protein